MKISGSVEEGSPPGSAPSGAAPGKKAESSAMIAWRKSPGEKVPALRDMVSFYTGKHFRVGKHFVASAVPLNNDRKE